MRRSVASFAVLLVMILSLFALTAGPAMAAPLLMQDGGSGGSGPHKIQSNCAAVLGVSTNLNQLTYAVVARSTATMTGTHVPVGTSVACAIRNAATKYEYGRVSGGLPGGGAVAVGKINVPTNVSLVLCAYGNTVFNDNHTASYKTANSAC